MNDSLSSGRVQDSYPNKISCHDYMNTKSQKDGGESNMNVAFIKGRSQEMSVEDRYITLFTRLSNYNFLPQDSTLAAEKEWEATCDSVAQFIGERRYQTLAVPLSE